MPLSAMTPKALRSIRLALGLTLTEFAERIGFPMQHVWDMETGKKPIVMLELNAGLERLAPDSPSPRSAPLPRVRD